MSKRHPSGDYAVGYCRPPEHGKIKPGERRNPRGRPPRPRAPDDIARKFLSEKVPIIDHGGKRRFISRYEVNLRNLYHLALKGEVSAAKEILAIGKEIGLSLPPTHDMRIFVEFLDSDGNGRPKVIEHCSDAATTPEPIASKIKQSRDGSNI